MIYIFIFVIILLILSIFSILYIKKTANKSNTTMPNTKNAIKRNPDDNYSDNPNPSFEVTLLDYKKNQLSISKSYENESVYFTVAKNKRINVYTVNKRYIGQIAIKDYKSFNLIASKPKFFEGIIIGYETVNIMTKKVIISVEAKEEKSVDIYKIDKSYLNTLITLKSIFKKNDVIETSYGPSTVIDVFDDHLIVDVPSLGKREIYDISETIK